MGPAVASAVRGGVVARRVGRVPVERTRFDGEFVVEGGQRIAAAALLFLTGFMFATPPVIAVLALAGIIR